MPARKGLSPGRQERPLRGEDKLSKRVPLLLSAFAALIAAALSGALPAAAAGGAQPSAASSGPWSGVGELQQARALLVSGGGASRRYHAGLRRGLPGEANAGLSYAGDGAAAAGSPADAELFNSEMASVVGARAARLRHRRQELLGQALLLAFFLFLMFKVVSRPEESPTAEAGAIENAAGKDAAKTNKNESSRTNAAAGARQGT